MGGLQQTPIRGTQGSVALSRALHPSRRPTRAPSRGFVPWRFSAAGRGAWANVRGGRGPKTSTWHITRDSRTAKEIHVARFPAAAITWAGVVTAFAVRP